MENTKWLPCFCTILLGAAIIVFTWVTFDWSQILMTVLGGLVIVKGLVNKCCCCPTKGKCEGK